jgi:hypothetical protein
VQHDLHAGFGQMAGGGKAGEAGADDLRSQPVSSRAASSSLRHFGRRTRGAA